MALQLYVFGSNGEGQLGIPATDIVDIPTSVATPPPLEQMQGIVGGDNHTLLVTKQRIVYGVGDNRKGQLSSDVEGNLHLESFKMLLKNAYFVAATCESSAHITVHGSPARSRIHTQGSGQWGELGLGDGVTDMASTAHQRPIDLPGRVICFAAGVWHYIAVLEDGSVYGWGKARLGQLGHKLSGKVTAPTKIEDVPFKPVRVICGKDFTYLVGPSSSGEHIILGKDKFNIISDMPKSIAGRKDVGATWHAIFVLFDDGKLIAWGRNAMWELIPPGLPPIDKIAVGSEHVLAVTKDGKLISWGWGKHGNCGCLSKVRDQVKNDMVSGFWNEVDVSGAVEFIGAGFCTSFVVVNAQSTSDGSST